MWIKRRLERGYLTRTETTRWTVHPGDGARYDIITKRRAMPIHVSAELLTDGGKARSERATPFREPA